MSDKKFQKKLAKIRKQGERDKQEYELRAAYAKYVPEKKKKKVSNIMLVTIVAAVIGYMVAAFVLQNSTGMEISSTLTTCWFSFWGVEIVALAGIKVSKTKHNTESSFDTYDCSESYEETEVVEDCVDELCE